MSLLSLVVLLVIAAVCGSLGQSLVGYSVGGCLVSMIVGLVGAWLGLWVAAQFHLPELFAINIDGKPFPIIWSIIGSAIFAALLGLVNRAITGRRTVV